MELNRFFGGKFSSLTFRNGTGRICPDSVSERMGIATAGFSGIGKISVVVGIAALVCGGLETVSRAQTTDETAYEHNRQGMIAMSQARFEEAIREFEKAAAIAEDYQIKDRSLNYTPVFMTAWASEKIGEVASACRQFERFLIIAPSEMVELTKAEHARSYRARFCR